MSKEDSEKMMAIKAIQKKLLGKKLSYREIDLKTKQLFEKFGKSVQQ